MKPFRCSVCTQVFHSDSKSPPPCPSGCKPSPGLPPSFPLEEIHYRVPSDSGPFYGVFRQANLCGSTSRNFGCSTRDATTCQECLKKLDELGE